MIERRSKYQYNTFYDSLRFRALMAHKESAGFDERLARETRYIHRQLKTDIGERLYVSKSSFAYEIRGDKLFEEERKEPFEEVVQRGNRRKRTDWRREDAEVQSFGTIQAIMTDPSTPDGTTILEITPPGSGDTNYKENYFRVLTKSEGKVLAASYLSNLSNREYREKIVSLSSNYTDILPESPTDVDLKSTPVVIPSHLDYSDPDKLAKFLLERKIGISEDELEQIWIDVAPGAVTSYVNTLIENPGMLYSIDGSYKEVLDAACESREKQLKALRAKNRREVIYSESQSSSYNLDGTRIEMHYHEENSLQMGGGGCGSGSCSTETSSDPVSAQIYVSGPDGKGPINVPCPDCGEINERPFGGYVAKCKSCKSEKILPKALRGKIKFSQASSQTS